MAIRAKWDDIFLKNSRYIWVMKIICAVVCFLSSYKLMQFYAALEQVPYPQLISGQLKLLIPLGAALLALASPKFGSAMVAGLVFLVYGGCAPALVGGAAALMMLEAITSETVHCILIAITPLCMIDIPSADGDGFTCWAYLLFALIVYFIRKLDSGTGYTAILWYSALLFIPGIITAGDTVINVRNPKGWIPGIVPASDFEFGFEQLLAVALQYVIVTVIGILICYVVGVLLKADIKALVKLQVDIREAIAFVVMAVLMIAMFIGLGKVQNTTVNYSVVQLLIQIILAYIITRPFASYKVSSALSRDMRQESQYGAQIVAGDVVRSTGEELQNIAATLYNEKNYNRVLFTGKKPVKNLLLIGRPDSNKKFIVENNESKINQKIEYLEAKDLIREVAEKGSIEWKKEKGVPRCYFINHFDTLYETEPGRKTADCILASMDEKEEDHESMFIIAADDINLLPDDCFGDKRVARVMHAKITDSIIFNDSYAILDIVGKGGFGDVYSAWHMRLNEKVVLKKVSVDKPSAASGKHEVELLKRVKHMYLPKIYDVFDANQAVYLVTDFVPGRSFSEYLKEGKRFDEKHVLKWAKQLAEAVDYLHSMQPPIIHSDIKPGNIMLTPDGDICLIDFNISALLDKDTAKSVGTTPGYSPIEQYGYVQNYLNLLSKKGINVEEFSRVKVKSTSDRSIPTGAVSVSVSNSSSQYSQGNQGGSQYNQGGPQYGPGGLVPEFDERSDTMDNDETMPYDDEATMPADIGETELMTPAEIAAMGLTRNGSGAGSGKGYSEIDAKTFLIDCMQKGYGTRSDIYAIGATLYHLVTGVKPGINFFTIKPAAQYPKRVSEDFAQVIDKCMMIDPDERYATIGELRKALEQIRV